MLCFNDSFRIISEATLLRQMQVRQDGDPIIDSLWRWTFADPNWDVLLMGKCLQSASTHVKQLLMA